MGFWAFVLLILGVLWLMQVIGTYYQMKHYRAVLGRITREGTSGFVGVGNARARLGKGVILILVADEDGIVTKALKMRGRTVFARFKEAPELQGLSIEELRDEEREGPSEAATMLAARRAVEQIDRIREEREVNAELG